MADEALRLDGHEVALNNVDKLLFPDDAITKRDLVAHYVGLSPVILPHLRDRPLTLQRFPDGIGAGGFFQKEAADHLPAWAGTVEIAKQDGSVRHVVAGDAATLAWLANQAAITLHATLSRAGRIDRPDRMILDLDPSDDDFGKVQEAASLAKALLDRLEVESFVQTTGSRGLHVVVALDATVGFDEVRALAHDIAGTLAEQSPRLLTVAHRKAGRGDRVFVDYLRNGYAQTAVAPYAVRALPTAPVATPLDWPEALAGTMTARRYTIANIRARLAQKDDPWAAIDRVPYDASTIAQRFRRTRS